MLFTWENIGGAILIIITGFLAFCLQKKYFASNNEPLCGFTVTKFKYSNMLFSWILAGISVAFYLLVSWFELPVAQFWNLELTPIVILGVGFLIGPFFGFIVAVLGNILGLLLAPGAVSIQLLLTWVRGLAACLPLLIMIIFVAKHTHHTHKLVMAFIFIIIIGLWILNLVLVINPHQFQLTYSARTKNVVLDALVVSSVVVFVSLFWLLHSLWKIGDWREHDCSRLSHNKKQQKQNLYKNHPIQLAKKKDQKISRAQINSFSKSSQLMHKNANHGLFVAKLWDSNCLLFTLISIGLFYIFVYYLMGSIVIGGQILHIGYLKYALLKTPTWFLSAVINVFVLRQLIVTSSRLRNYDFVIMKMRRRFILVMQHCIN